MLRDGYQMAQKGRAGAALAVAAVGSFFAGCVGTIAIAAFAPVLAAACPEGHMGGGPARAGRSAQPAVGALIATATAKDKECGAPRSGYENACRATG